MRRRLCRENRERRIGIDRVKDTVEKRLQEENETILHFQQLMRELVNQAIPNNFDNVLAVNQYLEF